jgi:hypothetical protein
MSIELTQTSAIAEKQFEIQSAIMVAKKFPRNEDQCFAKLMTSCARPSFAEEASYSFKRGRKKNDKGDWVDNFVEGPSVNLAREAGRIWGNVRWGLDIIRDEPGIPSPDGKTDAIGGRRGIRGWAWDMETNTKISAEAEFLKLIQRKEREEGGGYKKDAKTLWVIPDERDLRELTNRQGAFLVRNCILQVLPKDLIEDARSRCTATLQKDAKDDPVAARRKIIIAFQDVSVSPEMLETYLRHPLDQTSPVELVELRKIYKSIVDGNARWAEFVESPDERAEREKGKVDMDKLKQSTEQNRGHDDHQLNQLKTDDKKDETKNEPEKGAPLPQTPAEIEAAAAAATAATKTQTGDTTSDLSQLPKGLEITDPEALCTEPQFDYLGTARLKHDIDPSVWTKWVRGKFDIRGTSKLQQKHFFTALAFITNGGKE